MLKNWIISLSLSSTLLACTSTPKDPLEKISYRNPASSNDLITGSRQIITDLENPNIFNSKTCSEYIFKVTDFLYHAPADYMVPKTTQEIEDLKKSGSEILDTVLSLRKTKRPFPDSSLAARALLNEGFPGKPYVA